MTKIDIGCGTPENGNEKDIHRRLLDIFCPTLHFHEDERFFPVDVTSTIEHSSLWAYDPNQQISPNTCIQILDKGHIQNPSVDLQHSTPFHFTTVTDLSWVTSINYDGNEIFSPTLKIEEIYRMYRDEIIPELTIYGMVCQANNTSNSQLFNNIQSMDPLIQKAIADGFLLTYYFFFPAYESVDLASEGDWCGIVLLINGMPNSIEDLERNLNRYEPVLSCYFTKSIIGYPPSPKMIAQPNGIRRWSDVNRDMDENLNIRTHPIVYISRGRHHCYYEPTDKVISLISPWFGRITSDAVEEGLYIPAPVDNKVVGGTDFGAIKWYVYVLVPFLLPIAMCASGCDFPFGFDKSGLPPTHDVPDIANDSGYVGLPASIGTNFPRNPSGEEDPGNRMISIKLEYVDLSDQRFAAIWHFPGAWGSATKKCIGQHYQNEINFIQGVRRPLLAAWFNFNLFVDYIYGPGGVPGLAPIP